MRSHLKTRNMPLVILFILWCLALYLAFLAAPGEVLLHLHNSLGNVRATDSIFMILSPLIAIILTGLVSSVNKARLIFWRFRQALPGHRAFSKLAPGDPRIDVDALRRRVSPWPSTPEAENRSWYAIYRQHDDEPTVVQSQTTFLLARDLATVAFLFAIAGPWGLLFVQRTFWWPVVYTMLMLAHYLLLMIVARNHANRFVCNVLAEHTAKSDHPSRNSFKG